MILEDFLKNNYGYNDDVKAEWKKYVDTWRSWYQGKVKAFHNYTVYNGKRRIKMTRLSMQMAKKCCEDWADLLFNEKCTISISDQESQSELNEILYKNDFWRFMNENIEKSGASGTGAVVVSVKDMGISDTRLDVSNSEVILEYVDCPQIYPLTWSGRKITECAFASAQFERGIKKVYLSVHRLNENGNYIIENRTFKDSNGSLTEIENDGVLSFFDTGSPAPWFAVLSPQQANNIKPEFPWGISYFANAIDTLQALDLAFDSLSFEINTSRRRTYVKQEAVNVTLNNGEMVATFDPNDVSVYVLPEGVDGKDLIQTESNEIRSASLCETISKDLAIFSSQVGFGSDRYKFDAPSMATATQVISQNSEMFRRKKKHETGLESAIYDIIIAICHAATDFGRYNINPEGLTITFDDSVIEDKNAISDRALRELSAGVISKAEYRQRIFGEDKETSESKIEYIKENDPDIQTLMGFRE